MKCDGKNNYGKIAAQRAATKASKASGDLITPYWCQRHGAWHIGHSPLARGMSHR